MSDTGRGEICVASPSVFAGYTQPALNEGKFIFAGDTTWYRTGDSGVIDPDGTVWYRGRMDHMVKVRGYRIELPEIELTLLKHPAIAQAAVVAIDRAGEGKEIHAVCVCALPVSSQEIRSFLSDALPGFMVPRSVSFVDRLAVNDRGKVDRHGIAQQVQA